jgi:PPM family protein phosphatase
MGEPLSRMLHIESAGCTHPGKQRIKNEDRFLLDEGLGLFAVADGIGGHPHGDVAAEMALDAVRRYLADPDATWPPDTDRGTLRLAAAVKAANQEIHATVQAEPFGRRMGTTFAGALFEEAGAGIVHAGDSRCYRFRDGVLTRLTDDHTFLNEQLQKGVPREIAEAVPFGDVLTRAVGIHERLDVTARFEPVLPGDLFLLCTDGLSKPVEREEIAAILAEAGDLGAAAERLVLRANDRGGPDNVTVVLARALERA